MTPLTRENMLYPLTFVPIFKERIWGGRRMAELYKKELPPEVPIGESWEISDRPGDVSVIRNGKLQGKDLHWLMENHGRALLGRDVPAGSRFPLLIKILDAREKLSLQVHPPASIAGSLGGEPKTEMWHIVDADPGADLFVGLKKGVTRSEFETKVNTAAVAECFHRIPVKTGDTMFLPSGRVHAIGSGLVIFEIQQNSDTTYRVYDWGRCGLDGKPRQLHVAESLASIDFTDQEPSLVVPEPMETNKAALSSVLVNDPLFAVEACRLKSGDVIDLSPDRLQIIGVTSGSVRVIAPGANEVLGPGGFCMIPSECKNVSVQAGSAAGFLVTMMGS